MLWLAGCAPPAMVVQQPPPVVVVQQPTPLLSAHRLAGESSIFPPTTITLAFVQPEFLGAPKANVRNPAAGGNAEGNWWTGSRALETDCEGNRVTATTKLSSECIAKKKVAEIKARQEINELNGRYKVEKLERAEKRAAAEAAQRAERDAEIKARQAKYALKR